MGYDPIEVNQAASQAARAIRKNGGAGYTKTKTYIREETKEPVDIFGDGNLFVHISDEEPNLVGAVLKAVGTAFPAGGTEFPVPENAIQVDVSGIRLIVETDLGIPLVMVVPSGIDGVSKGLYFGTNEIMYPASLTTETTHTINPKYLPGVTIDLADYGIDLSTLVLNGGGTVKVEGTEEMWRKINENAQGDIKFCVLFDGDIFYLTPSVLATTEGEVTLLGMTLMAPYNSAVMISTNVVLNTFTSSSSPNGRDTRVYATVTQTPIPS